MSKEKAFQNKSLMLLTIRSFLEEKKCSKLSSFKKKSFFYRQNKMFCTNQNIRAFYDLIIGANNFLHRNKLRMLSYIKIY